MTDRARPEARPLIIDCDPGVDDATALLLAFASPEFELLAVTTTGGNVPASATARNARILRQIAGRDDVPVYAGAERPLRREPAGAGEFHGPEGLGDLEPFEPRAPLAPGMAAEAIIDLVMARPRGSVSIAVMGPMTNLAMAMLVQPALADRLGPIVVMGGARSEGGNITASAEFNIWADPEAAAVVFDSGCVATVLGLDATHQVRATEARIAALEAAGTASARTAASMLRFSQRIERQIVGWDAAPLHDPCTIAWLLRPHLFQTRPCRVRIETASDLTRGHTAVEFRVEAATARHHWAVTADGAGVFALIAERMETAQ
jgi:purine nucleosidase